jgi:hypothetical protein
MRDESAENADGRHAAHAHQSGASASVAWDAAGAQSAEKQRQSLRCAGASRCDRLRAAHESLRIERRRRPKLGAECAQRPCFVGETSARLAEAARIPLRLAVYLSAVWKAHPRL